jgi:hypothetical protein
MAILGSQGITVDVVTIINASLCYNQFTYAPVNPTEHADPADIGAYWVASILPVWKAGLSQQASIFSLSVASNHPPGIPAYAPFFQALGLVGTVASDSLPPFVTARIYKQPDNSTIDPVDAQPFKISTFGLSGVAEDDQAKGVLTSAAVTAFNAIAEALETFTADSVDYQMTMGRQVDSLVGGNPLAVAFVLETNTSPYLGSRVTRKIGL